MQAEETVVKLSNNVFSAEEVVEQPPLPELSNVGTEYGRGVRPEAARLIDCYQQVFELKRLQLKVSRKRVMSE